ncbi:MAG: phosphomethylpyrimidine synthase ThiC [Methanocalculus sp. MSAO_Arc1]|uniref:phosphomethylpyrimidine synthase ThiC n=1 Tax=Methanocalculus TaxID=71151 RepID=UPI000FEE3078|nr:MULTISPECIES: phosphomethylpyrimidine synthase ThiC [unclassified Methanocalculus]MCP1661603.1 phosphomethylpyrimidine synthase [Methanocalculus sp. AMF5]RQD81316.1 MAG: phosphomethylpyrimidine synthase ThiC [Methanocalculus sp. MSAO_Arc1]
MVFMHSLVRQCRSGLPPELLDLAVSEGISPDRMAGAIADGRIVVPANPRRTIRYSAIGEGCRVKVNVNIGTSAVRCDPEFEMIKARAALMEGADALMDLSTAGDLQAIRREILSLPAPVGTVPIYEAVRRAGTAQDLTADILFSVIRDQCRQGVDFMTLHCGVNHDALHALRTDPRMLGVVSRGGVFHVAWMVESGEENPLYAEYDYLLEILAEEDVTLSLGDGMRPGALVDSGRLAKATEYLTLGRLAKQARLAGVQRMIEGPGHIPIHEVAWNVKVIKEVTDSAPLYLLGPLVTDIAAGYDHVVGAIGGAIAASAGADFLCMVSPAEHLALPDEDDIIEGTRVARIAAHAGDIARRGGVDAFPVEMAMARARRDLDWDAQYQAALFPEYARSIHDRDGETETCSMCGDICAVKLVSDLLPKKE